MNNFNIICLSGSMRKPKIEIEKLRAIGWANWDPIGLADCDGQPPDGAEDEYDSYLLQVAGMLANGKGNDAAISFLTNIAANHMGMGFADRCAALRTVNQIRRHLIELGYDVR
ncbi:MAG: hypothetical protein NW223_14555 [Hyphomicrobiaceae bacterium]|nr:hypothetical protein [Hyphomicrobiaceae bacterium]